MQGCVSLSMMFIERVLCLVCGYARLCFIEYDVYRKGSLLGMRLCRVGSKDKICIFSSYEKCQFSLKLKLT